MKSNETAQFVAGIGSDEPFNHWHAIQNVSDKDFTTACGLRISFAHTVSKINDIPLMDTLCPSADCRMRNRLSQALNKCAVENRQSEWTVRY